MGCVHFFVYFLFEFFFFFQSPIVVAETVGRVLAGPAASDLIFSFIVVL